MTAAVAKRLRASSRRVINSQDDLIDQAENYDELIKREDALDDLAEIA
ncbi:MAG: hypothetical protein WBA16_07595 [Nonlabens sp.]